MGRRSATLARAPVYGFQRLHEVTTKPQGPAASTCTAPVWGQLQQVGGSAGLGGLTHMSGEKVHAHGRAEKLVSLSLPLRTPVSRSPSPTLPSMSDPLSTCRPLYAVPGSFLWWIRTGLASSKPRVHCQGGSVSLREEGKATLSFSPPGDGDPGIRRGQLSWRRSHG